MINLCMTDHYNVYYSWVRIRQRATEGVGVLVAKEIHKEITNVEPISSRIMLVRIESEDLMTDLIQMYAPREGTEDEDLNEFYDIL